MKNLLMAFAFSVAVTAVVAVGLPVAFAEADSATSTPATHQLAQMSVNVERNGNIKLVGQLTAVSGTNLTVQSWGGAWAVDASAAKIVRRFNGESNFAEYQVGDTVTVWGDASASGLTVKAKMVKDESIQKRGADFIGVISGVNASSTTSFTLTVKNRGALAITVNADTKITINGQSASSTAGLTNGMYASVTGVWDTTNSTVIAATVNARTAASVLDDANPSFLQKIFRFFGGRGKGEGKGNQE